MKLYLIENPNDVRTWEYPTFNKVWVAIPPGGVNQQTLEIVEDSNGEIYIEQWTSPNSKRVSHIRVSASAQKMNQSDWIKRFAVKK